MENIISNSYYEVSIIDSLAIIYFKGNIFQLLMSTEDNENFLALLNKFQYDTEIKALFFYNDPGVFGEDNYELFLLYIMNHEKKDDKFEIPQFSDKDIRSWEIRKLDEYITFLASYKKLCFTLLSGDIVTPFFGGSLAMDIRYATPNMVFSLAHNKYGLHPSGGLPFFLANQLGYNKAMELMFSDKIDANEALNLGLINKIIEKNNPVEIAIEEISTILKNKSSNIRRTKQLASFTRNTIFDYFQFERSILGF
jgi:enoyl-CoA hydratase/carnithine racemase